MSLHICADLPEPSLLTDAITKISCTDLNVNYQFQSPNGVNLVTLRPTPATAVRKEDGTIHCTREVLAETGYTSQLYVYAI